MSKTPFSDELREFLGDEGFLALVEQYGGTRLYVPQLKGEDTHILEFLPRQTSLKLSEIYGVTGLYVRVPLAREFRAETYRQRGLSDAQIAVRLGMTEPGVDKLFSRVRERYGK